MEEGFKAGRKIVESGINIFDFPYNFYDESKRKEFEQKVKDENLKMRAFNIELDHYYDGYPHYMGCVQKNGKWVIYETDERSGRAYIYNEFDNESDAFDKFYKSIKAQIKIENFGK